MDALEAWAAGEAARIMVGLFGVAGVLMAVAIPPSLALGSGPERRRDEAEAGDRRRRIPGTRDGDESEPTFAL